MSHRGDRYSTVPSLPGPPPTGARAGYDGTRVASGNAPPCTNRVIDYPEDRRNVSHGTMRCQCSIREDGRWEAPWTRWSRPRGRRWPTLRSVGPSRRRRRTSGTTRARSTSSSTRSPTARSGRRPTRRSCTDVWKADPAHWRDRVRALAAERPDATEVDLAWAVVEEMSLRAAPAAAARPSTRPAGARAGCRCRPTRRSSGRSTAMLAQGVHFAVTRAEHHREVPGDVGRRSGSWRRRRTAASASTPRCRFTRRPGAGRRPRPSSAGCAGARPRACRSTTWARSSR